MVKELWLFQVCRCLRLVPLKIHHFHGAGTSGVSTPVRSGTKVS